MTDSPRPTWDAMVTRLAEANALKEARGLAFMHAAHGWRVGTRCGDCAFLAVHRMANTYDTCSRYKITNGPGTDWRLRWAACGLFEPRQGEQDGD